MSHRRFRNEFQVQLHAFVGHNSVNAHNMFELVSRTWTNEIAIDMEAALHHLFSSAQLKEIAKVYGYNGPGPKHRFTTHILEHLQRMYKVAKHHTDAICHVQRQWRQSRKVSNGGPWPKTPAVNDTDVFTMEELSALPPHTIFSYCDPHGSVYAFSAPDLHYEVHTNGPKNPYTREEIPSLDLERLENMMKRLPCKQMPRPEDTWTTSDDAFGHALGLIERLHGIRANVEWMTAWNKARIRQIFYDFHCNITIPTHHMDLDLIQAAYEDENPISCCFALAKEMLRLANDTEERYQMYMICNLFFAFANNSRHFRKHLPNWILLGAATT
jgi:hypothetical protein